MAYGCLFFVLLKDQYLFVQVKLTVEVPSAVCDDCYSRVLNEFMKQAKVLLDTLNVFSM